MAGTAAKRVPRRWLLAAAIAAAAAALAGCQRSSPPTPPVASSPATPAAPAVITPTANPTAPAPSVTPSASASGAAVAPPLPTGCPELLSLPSVEQAIGTGLLGQVTYLKAAAVPQSGRTGRVTCGYGVPVHTPAPVGTRQPDPTAAAGAQPLLSASYITYVDAKTAATRVALTVQTDGAGAAVKQVTVSGRPASVLVGAHGSELVMSDGARTIVLVASPVILAVAAAPPALEAMAAIMLRFGQPASASSGPSSVAAAPSDAAS